MSTEAKWRSVCCAWPPLDELSTPQWIRIKPRGKAVKMASGTCGKCRDKTTFELQEEE